MATGPALCACVSITYQPVSHPQIGLIPKFLLTTLRKGHCDRYLLDLILSLSNLFNMEVNAGELAFPTGYTSWGITKYRCLVKCLAMVTPRHYLILHSCIGFHRSESVACRVKPGVWRNMSQHLLGNVDLAVGEPETYSTLKYANAKANAWPVCYNHICGSYLTCKKMISVLGGGRVENVHVVQSCVSLLLKRVITSVDWLNKIPGKLQLWHDSNSPQKN